MERNRRKNEEPGGYEISLLERRDDQLAKAAVPTARLFFDASLYSREFALLDEAIIAGP